MLRKKYSEPETEAHYKSAIHSTLLGHYSKLALGYALFIVSPSHVMFRDGLELKINPPSCCGKNTVSLSLKLIIRAPLTQL